MSRNIPITEFDTLTVNPSMQILKALVPFLDYPMQRQVSLIIRVTELQQTMKFFSNPSSVSGFSSSASGCANKIHSIDDIFSNEKLLDSLLVYCPENYASMIKTFRQFSKMSDLFNMMNLANDDSDGNFNFNFGGGYDSGSGGNEDKSNVGNSDKASDVSDDKPNNNSGTAYNSSGDEASNNNAGSEKSGSSGSAQTGGFGKAAPNINLGSLFGSSPADSIFNSFMKPEQQAMYDEYIRQLNSLDFDKPDDTSKQ